MPAHNESSTYNAYRLAATRLHARLFRNNVGMFYTSTGIPIRAGLHPGSADLVGWRTIVVTPEMVGSSLAVFLSVEVKIPGGRTPKTVSTRQERWRQAVIDAGGIGLKCFSVETMQRALTGEK